jgi:hypothetical protein
LQKKNWFKTKKLMLIYLLESVVLLYVVDVKSEDGHDGQCYDGQGHARVLSPHYITAEK